MVISRGIVKLLGFYTKLRSQTWAKTVTSGQLVVKKCSDGKLQDIAFKNYLTNLNSLIRNGSKFIKLPKSKLTVTTRFKFFKVLSSSQLIIMVFKGPTMIVVLDIFLKYPNVS